MTVGYIIKVGNVEKAEETVSMQMTLKDCKQLEQELYEICKEPCSEGWDSIINFASELSIFFKQKWIAEHPENKSKER